MRKIEYFPFAFFIFLSSFLITKSLFILLFNASFSPSFILKLTPLYLISSINEFQLLFFSLLIVIVDTYLHVRDTRKNLLYSFIPTLIMSISVSIVIASNAISVEYTAYYLLFFLLLTILLIDNQRLLPERKGLLSLLMEKRRFLPFPIPLPIKKSTYFIETKPTKLPKTLSQLEGLKPAHLEALEAVGIKSIEDLANIDSITVIERLIDKDIKPKIGQDVIDRWIESARNLRK
jgi:hypothetical protein